MFYLEYNGFPMEELGIHRSYREAKGVADKNDMHLLIREIDPTDLLTKVSQTVEIRRYLSLDKFSRDPMVNRNDILSLLGSY